VVKGVALPPELGPSPPQMNKDFAFVGDRLSVITDHPVEGSWGHGVDQSPVVYDFLTMCMVSELARPPLLTIAEATAPGFPLRGRRRWTRVRGRAL
jgi:hypothetical protein